MEKLTNGEWRLFLLSDCIKYYADIYKLTEELRKQGQQSVLEGIGKREVSELEKYIGEEQVFDIRKFLRKEWKFTHKVIDLGEPSYTCDYCQHQIIRYQYLCVNEINRKWLKLGSSCVGKIVHGEEAMSNDEFANDFVKGLDKLKNRSVTKDEHEKKNEQIQENVNERKYTLEELRKLRLEQHNRIKDHTAFLKNKFPKSEFLRSLQQRWSEGRLLTTKQEEALINWSNREKVKDDFKQQSKNEENNQKNNDFDLFCNICGKPTHYTTYGACGQCLKDGGFDERSC